METVELKCHVCEEPFTVEYGPGRPRKYCGVACRALAYKVARRIVYVEQAELRRRCS